MKADHGFVRRVVLVGILSAALGALVAAIVAILAVDHLLASQADRRLKGAVIELAGEFDREPPERAELLERKLAEENREIAPSGISLAVFRGKQKIAGLGAPRTPNVGKCETQGMLGVRTRSCSMRYGSWTLVASQASDIPRLRWLYLLAALAACITGAAAGGWLGYGIARWAIRPLQAIADQVRGVAPGKDTSLGVPSDCQEIEAVRCAVEGLLTRIQLLLGPAERFAAAAAHELRNPLAALSIELELLAESVESKERASVLAAHRRVLALSGLVERLLISALPTENLSRGFETVSLEEVILEELQSLPEPLRRATEFAPGPEGLVRGDSQLLRSLVHNALENAHKHGLGAGVKLRLCEADRQVIMEVADSGPGIPQEYLEQVFSPFFRVPGTESAGHGLGLALIGHVAQAHGGAARFVDSEAGATLIVTLPAWTPSAD